MAISRYEVSAAVELAEDGAVASRVGQVEGDVVAT